MILKFAKRTMQSFNHQWWFFCHTMEHHSVAKKVYKHINDNLDVIFFTYPTIDNYLNHFWYNMHEETRSDVDRSDKSFLNVFPKGDIYSWYKGNIFPDDMEPKKKERGM